jgi:hypothetical protein
LALGRDSCTFTAASVRLVLPSATCAGHTLTAGGASSSTIRAVVVGAPRHHRAGQAAGRGVRRTGVAVVVDAVGQPLVGRRVHRRIGLVAVGGLVNVAGAGDAPVLGSPVPANRGVTARVGTPLALSVGASAGVTHAWTIDGADAGSGSSLTFSPTAQQVGEHTIEVTASWAGGATRRAWDVVVLDKDGDDDGWTTVASGSPTRTRPARCCRSPTRSSEP